ncbi:cytochrome oxidase maturation protein, cbb3-type [Zhouia amylolytica]|uniref:Cytochrome oxidase maturation protein, cbb3-type n=2 Tax=Zhouia amylolytica TaxID=376730 RepID=A0A1I6RE58_9FLAO|nr:cytochrome oxidase maturation protein, cbb3-type [Zhouia amylolytica]
MSSNLTGMSVIYILITVSIAVAVVFFIAFVTAVKRGQFDDDYTPSIRMLFEDELVKDKKKTNQQSSNK